MEDNKEYYAFISYKREDEKWAKWIQNKLEHYRFPTNLNGRKELPKHIRPTFRDVTDLNPGLLAEEIDKALRNSQWLIIVCSPRSAKSPWVCKEAQTFIDLGRADHIIPFVIEGIPFSDNPNMECYPDALLKLTGNKELIASNINEMGRDAAAIKVISRMFGLRFDSLWQRHEKEQKRKRWLIATLALLLMMSGIIIGMNFKLKNNQLKENAVIMEKQMDSIRLQNILLHKDSIIMAQQIDSINIQNKLIYNQKDSINKTIVQLREEQNRLIAASNSILRRESALLASEAEKMSNSDSYMARRLALLALPSKLEKPDRPYTIAAEKALRSIYYKRSGFIGVDSIYNYDNSASNIAILKKRTVDSTELIFQSIGNNVYNIDLDKGERLSLFSTIKKIDQIAAIRDKNGIPLLALSHSCDSTITLWKATTKDGDWVQYDSLSYPKDELYSHTFLYPNCLLLHCQRLNRIVIMKSDSKEWTVNQYIEGNGIGTLEKGSFISYKDSMIYIWKNNDKQYKCIDTLKAPWNLYGLSSNNRSNIFAAYGLEGILIYTYFYTTTKKHEWKLTNIIADTTSYHRSITRVYKNDIIATRDGGVYHYTKSNNQWVKECIFNYETFEVNSLEKGIIAQLWNNYKVVYYEMTPKRYNERHLNKNGYLWFKDNGETLEIRRDLAFPKQNVIIISKDGNWWKAIDTLDNQVDTTYCLYRNGFLLSLSKDSTLCIWKRWKGNVKFTLLDKIKDPFFCNYNYDYVYISKNGHNLLFKNDSLHFWNKTEMTNTWHYWTLELPYTGINFDKVTLSDNGEYASYKIIDDKSTLYTSYLCGEANNSQFIETISRAAEDFVISDDGRTIAGVPWVFDNIISLYRKINGKWESSKLLHGHTKKITYLDFSPDGRYLVSTSNDSTVRIWEIASGVCLDILKDNGKLLKTAEFTEDGENIKSLGIESYKSPKNKKEYNIFTYFWEFLPLQKLIDRTHKVIEARPISDKEKMLLMQDYE